MRTIPPQASGPTGAWDVAISRGGDLLALANHPLNGQLTLSGPARTRPNLLPGGLSTIAAAAFSPDGRLLVTGNAHGQVWLWDATTAKVVNRLDVHAGMVTRLAFSRDGSRLATGGEDGSVTVWDVAQWAWLHRLKGHRAAVAALAFSADGRHLASADDSGEVRAWDLQDTVGVAILQPPVAVSNSSCVTVSRDGRFLATGHLGMVWLWDTATRQPVLSLPPEPPGLIERLTSPPSVIFRIAFSPDGRLLAAGDGASRVTLWDTNTGRAVRVLHGWPPEVYEVFRAIGSLAFSPDGTRLAAGLGMPTMSVGDYGRQAVKVWDSYTGNEVGFWQAHSNTIAGLAFAPDGSRLATASHDGTVKLWEAGTWRELHSWTADSISVRRTRAGAFAADPSLRSQGFESVAFAPDGRSLAAGLVDGTIVAWDLATGRERYAHRGHSSLVYDLAYSSDGRTLASAGWDRLIKLWDARTGRELRTLRGHANWVMGVAFTPDSRNLASLDFDGVLRLWGEPPGRRTVESDVPALPITDAEDGPAEKAAVAPIPEASRSLIGRWEGKIQVNKTSSLRIVIRVTPGPDGRLRAVADSPDQGGKDIPVSAMTLEDGAWSWAIPAAEARFEGRASGGGDVYEGTFLQNGIKMPLVLERTDRARR